MALVHCPRVYGRVPRVYCVHSIRDCNKVTKRRDTVKATEIGCSELSADWKATVHGSVTAAHAKPYQILAATTAHAHRQHAE